MWRYFIGFMITIGLLVLLIILLVGGGKPKVPNASKPLYSYADTDASARLTIDGVINYQQSHQQIQITVDRNTVTYDQLEGYDGKTVNHRTYANSRNAYATFLRALGHAGFTQGNTSEKLKDERGYCPLGRRYIFELIDGGKSLERFWATSCGKPKTYNGNLPITRTLFQRQVPDFDDLTQDLQLGG